MIILILDASMKIMNIRENNLLAAKWASVERRDRGRQRPGSTETMNASLPDDLTLRIFGFCSAKCLLTVEVASRALRDLRWHKTNDAHWCGLLRARWPREGPALASAPICPGARLQLAPAPNK